MLKNDDFTFKFYRSFINILLYYHIHTLFFITFITTNYQNFIRVSPPLGFLTPRFLYFRRPAIANAVPSAPARVEQRGLRT